jgi:DNA-binding CsgD family transcriptional regulator
MQWRFQDMNLVKHLQKSSMLTSSPLIQNICQPLLNNDIDFFVYGKTYSDDSIVALSTHSAWLEHYIPNVYNLNYVENYLFETTVNQPVLVSADIFPDNRAFRHAKSEFGLQCGLAVPVMNGGSREMFYFATKNSSYGMYNFFLANIDLLKNFITYFKEKADKLINEAENAKLPSVFKCIEPSTDIDQQSLNLLPRKIKQDIFTKINPDKHYLINDAQNRYLTTTEYKCIPWLIKGKTAEEIGIILGMSRRTVEAHIANMKNKFDCIKTIQLIYTLIKLGLNEF